MPIRPKQLEKEILKAGFILKREEEKAAIVGINIQMVAQLKFLFILKKYGKGQNKQLENKQG